MLACFEEEGILLIEVEALDLGQLFAAISEEESEVVCLLSLVFQIVSVVLNFCEGSEDDVVWQEVCVSCRYDVCDMK